MALILADTDILIDFLAGRQPVADQVRCLIREQQLLTSAVTAFEILSGAGEGNQSERIRDFVDAVNVLPVDREAACRGAAEQRRLASIGFSLQTADALIAGVALANDLPLLTRNIKHFEKVAGLRLASLS